MIVQSAMVSVPLTALSKWMWVAVVLMWKAVNSGASPANASWITNPDPPRNKDNKRNIEILFFTASNTKFLSNKQL